MNIILFFISIILILIFFKTVPSTTYLGDSGEIITAIYRLGIPHPPGYPLQTLLGKLATFLIPYGDIAFRANLYPVFITLLNFILLYKIILNILKNLFKDIENKQFTPLAIITSLIFITSEVYWYSSIQAKGGIYISTIFVFLLCIFYLLNLYESKKEKYFYLILYFSGFLPALHHTTLFFTIVFIFLSFYILRENLNLNKIFSGISFFVLSFFSSFFYLFIRNGKTTYACWSDIGKFNEIIDHIMRKVYFQAENVPFTLQSFVFKIKTLLIHYLTNYNIAILFFISGIFILYKYSKKLFYIIFMVLIINSGLLIYFTGNTISSLSAFLNRYFYLLPDIISLFFVAIGICFLYKILIKKYELNKNFVIILLSALPLLNIFINVEKNNLSRFYLSYDNALNIFKTLKPNDILFTRLDCPTYDIYYIQYSKNKFRDYKVYDREGTVLDKSIYKEIINTKKFNYENVMNIIFKLYEENKGKLFSADELDILDKKITSFPYGIIYKLIPQEEIDLNGTFFMPVYTIRDYFNNENLDFFHRDIIARYFSNMAFFSAFKNEDKRFNFYINLTEKISYDNNAIIKRIAAIYFFAKKDLITSVEYLEKAMQLDKTDIRSVNLLIYIYTQLNDYNNVLKWMQVYYDLEWDVNKKNIIKNKIEEIKSKIKQKQ